MNNIDKLIDSIGANFERILRWVYPGALFIVLLYASRPIVLENLHDKIGIWGLVASGLVSGFVIYLFQGYVISQLITIFFILIKWDIRQGLQVDPYKSEKGTNAKPETNPIVRLFDRMARATQERWSIGDPQNLGNYLNYTWAIYHAVLMTGWLTLFFYLTRKESADSIPIFQDITWWWVVVPASLLIVGGLFTHLLLSRIRLEDP
jgi:hypothetical protein